MLFRDRVDAGRQLLSRLGAYQGRPDVLVLGLPRGGIPVAYEVARGLGAPLDVFVVRKLGVPGQEDERLPTALREQQRLSVVMDAWQVDGRANVVVDQVLVVGRRGDVHQRQRPVGEGGFSCRKGHTSLDDPTSP